MRNFKAIFAVVLALAVHGVHAVTGPAAADLITSDPKTVNYEAPDSVLMRFQRIDKGVFCDYDYSIGFDTMEDDVEMAFASLSGIITAKEAMLNAMKALANVEILYESDKQLGKRIDALEKSAKKALAQVDKTEVIDEHGNQIESILKIIEKPESGSETIEVTTEGTPVDDMSLSFTGKPKGPKTPAPLEIKGFSDVVGLNWLIPHPKGSALEWDSLQELLDLKTIDSTSDSTRSFGIRLGLKGWDAPQAGAAKCDDSLSGQLLTGDKTHYVLTKLGDALHYTPVGKLAVMSPDGKSVVTNETTDGSASVAGAAGATQGFVPYSDGNGGFAWDYATPTVAWDDSTDTLTVTTPREDDETKTVVFPRISVEKEDGEDSTTYTVTWRDLNGEKTEETEISVPKASAAVSPDGATVVTNATGHANEAALAGFWDPGTKDGHFPVKSGNALVWVPTNAQESASAVVDGVTIVTNAPGHANEAALAGFWDPGTKDGHFPVKVGNSLTWMPTNVVSVITNKVDGDKVTITSTEANGEKTLGLKDWNANYGGKFPLFLVNDQAGAVRHEVAGDERRRRAGDQRLEVPGRVRNGRGHHPRRHRHGESPDSDPRGRPQRVIALPPVRHVPAPQHRRIHGRRQHEGVHHQGHGRQVPQGHGAGRRRVGGRADKRRRQGKHRPHRRHSLPERFCHRGTGHGAVQGQQRQPRMARAFARCRG